MGRTLAARLFVLCLTLWVSAALPVAAQPVTEPATDDAQPQDDGPSGEATTTEPEGPGLIGPPAPGPEQMSPEDAEMAAWASLAARTEVALTDLVASEFALGRLRAAIVEWRERFLVEIDENATRIATVNAQIAALGAAPEGDAVEEPRVAQRRAELEAQLRKLRAPQLLAQEAFAHADGLISELDVALRVQRTQALMVRGLSPLDLGIWPEAVAAIASRAHGMMSELRTTFGSASRWEIFAQNLPAIVVLLALSALLLQRGQVWTVGMLGRMGTLGWRGAGVWRLVVAFGQVALPLLGLVALQSALMQTGLFGFRFAALVESIVVAGGNVVVARWLAGQFFAPERAEVSSMDIDPANRARIRRLLETLGWILATYTMVEAALAGADVPETALIVARFPLQLAQALVLFRLGQMFSRTRGKVTDTESARYRSAALPLFGKALMIVAALGPLLAALGFTRLSDALIQPAVMTLALMGAVILLQRLVYDVYALISGDSRRGDDALLPVLLGFVIVMIAVPVLALIWGVRAEELGEIWARFREGYSLGETRVTPTVFLTFGIVFVVGYAATRLLQGVLRVSILPRTHFDTGARNAIVAGVGYVGIFAAALAAITSAGINLSSLAIVAGALSVGIGFGLQNIVSNFVSGIILLIERPISEGDWIEVGNQMGYVRGISVRSTRIETFDRTDVIIPNADLVSGTVTNWTRNNSVGRARVPVGVAYGTDTEKVQAILQEIAEAHPMVLLQPPPAVYFLGFGADSLNFEIRAILRDINFVMVVTSEMNHAIAARFAEEGIEIPFAQRDVWFRNAEVLQAGGGVPQEASKAATEPASDDNAVHNDAKPQD